MTKMVDIGSKDLVRRVAVAMGSIKLKPSTVKAIRSGSVQKGDVVSASRLTGISAAKATSSMLPLCHQVPLESVEVDVRLLKDGAEVTCKVAAMYKTGVEMEALVGATAALLNIWDMVKYLEKDEGGQYPDTLIRSIRVVSKEKGGAKRGR